MGGGVGGGVCKTDDVGQWTVGLFFESAVLITVACIILLI